jgi:NADP-dependent 3-hydroxy acid dehydrogenase YdfG
VNISSVAGRRPFPGGAVYSATKFAMRCISAGLRLELSPTDKIRVTDIAPGVVDTELQDSITDTEVRERFHKNWSDKTPLAPDDVAQAVVYTVTQPSHVNVNEILIRPTDQPT